MHQAEIIVLLFAVIAASVLIARKIALPYPVVLVLVGLGLSFIPHLPEVKLDPDIVFYFFLPPLLYPAALFTSWRDFRRNLQPILLLAIGLVLFTVVLVVCGAFAHSVANLGGGIFTRRNRFSAGRSRGHKCHSPPSGAASNRQHFGRRKPGERRGGAGSIAICSSGTDDWPILVRPSLMAFRLGRSRRDRIRLVCRRRD